MLFTPKKIALMVTLGAACALPVHANEVNTVLNKIEKSITASQSSQKRIDSLSDDARESFEQYSGVVKLVEGLQVYNAQLQQQIDSQTEEMSALNASIDNVTTIERQIMPLMLSMIDSLEAFIELDLPFSLTERRQRIEFLRKTLNQSNVSVSEKLRQVLEAYQVEIDYGRKIETYRDTVTLASGERDVDILRIGRTTLVYQSMDKLSQGVWNQELQQWQDLDQTHRAAIKKGIQIANQIIAPDLMPLPIILTENK